MKKYLIIASLFVIVSCSKSSNSSSSYSFSANFDGQSKSFNTQVSAIKAQLADTMYNLTIMGIGASEQSGLTLWSDKDDFIAGKTFDLDALGGSTFNEMVYVAPIGSSDPTSQWTSTYELGVEPEEFHCTITEATSAYIKGTFSGTIYKNSDTLSKKIITNGQFFAKF